MEGFNSINPHSFSDSLYKFCSTFYQHYIWNILPNFFQWCLAFNSNFAESWLMTESNTLLFSSEVIEISKCSFPLEDPPFTRMTPKEVNDLLKQQNCPLAGFTRSNLDDGRCSAWLEFVPASSSSKVMVASCCIMIIMITTLYWV